MSDTKKGIFLGVIAGILLFFSGIGIIENVPYNDSLWRLRYEDNAVQQAIVELSIETGEINPLILIICTLMFSFVVGLIVRFIFDVALTIGGLVVVFITDLINIIVGKSIFSLFISAGGASFVSFFIGASFVTVFGIVGGVGGASVVGFVVFGSANVGFLVVGLVVLVGALIAKKSTTTFSVSLTSATAITVLVFVGVFTLSRFEFSTSIISSKVTQTALSSQAQDAPIPSSLTPPATSTESPIEMNLTVPTPDTFATN